MLFLSRLSPTQKAWLRSRYSQARDALVRAFLSYDASRLSNCLHALGVQAGDSVILHSAFVGHYGFRGSIDDLIQAFIDVVGPEGNLLMVSLPYRSSALDYLTRIKRFDVRNTPSMMGLVSEYFRRRPEVRRSLNPMHPILARGRSADWLVEDHQCCVYSCGPDSPFDKLAKLDGKAVFFNVPFATFTFFHYLEHLVHQDMPFPLYADPPFEVPVIDRSGQASVVRTFAFSREAIRRRRFQVLEDELRERGLIQRRRVGNTRIEMIRLRDAIDCVLDMKRQGRTFYDLAGAAPSSATAAGLAAVDNRP